MQWSDAIIDSISSADFLPLIYRYALEAITVITLDTHMGGLKENPDPRVKDLIVQLQSGIRDASEIMMGVPWYKVSRLLSPQYRRMEASFNAFGGYVKEMLMAMRERLEKEGAKSEDLSVMEKVMLRCNMEPEIPTLIAFDMMAAGVDTTGNTLAFLFGHLSTHPEAQVRKVSLWFLQRRT